MNREHKFTTDQIGDKLLNIYFSLKVVRFFYLFELRTDF